MAIINKLRAINWILSSHYLIFHSISHLFIFNKRHYLIQTFAGIVIVVVVSFTVII